MKFRSGLVIGGAVGYYFGAKAGRRRYQQLSRAVRQIRATEPVEAAAEKLRAVIDLTKERARGVMDSRSATPDNEINDYSISMN